MRVKRVIVVTGDDFSAPAASANYIENFLLAVRSQGAAVQVLCLSATPEYTSGARNGIPYDYFYDPQLTGSRLNYLRNIVGYGAAAIPKLKSWGMGPADCVILYTDVPFLQTKVRRLQKQYRFALAACSVERHTADQFEKGWREIYYWQFLYSYYCTLPSLRNILPISRYLERHFKRAGCNTLVLPVLASPPAVLPPPPPLLPVRHFIYAGRPAKKDNLLVMLQGIRAQGAAAPLKLHFVGVCRSVLAKELGSSAGLLDEMADRIQIHPTLQRAELEQLYYQMHFILVAKASTKVNLAGFPSKVVEAAGHGIVPVVSSVGDYTSLYFQNGTDSIQFSPCTAEACGQAVAAALALSEDDYARMRQASWQCVHKQLAYPVWAERLAAYLDDLPHEG